MFIHLITSILTLNVILLHNSLSLLSQAQSLLSLSIGQTNVGHWVERVGRCLEVVSIESVQWDAPTEEEQSPLEGGTTGYPWSIVMVGVFSLDTVIPPQIIWLIKLYQSFLCCLFVFGSNVQLAQFVPYISLTLLRKKMARKKRRAHGDIRQRCLEWLVDHCMVIHIPVGVCSDQSPFSWLHREAFEQHRPLVWRPLLAMISGRREGNGLLFVSSWPIGTVPSWPTCLQIDASSLSLASIFFACLLAIFAWFWHNGENRESPKKSDIFLRDHRLHVHHLTMAIQLTENAWAPQVGVFCYFFTRRQPFTVWPRIGVFFGAKRRNKRNSIAIVPFTAIISTIFHPFF